MSVNTQRVLVEQFDDLCFDGCSQIESPHITGASSRRTTNTFTVEKQSTERSSIERHENNIELQSNNSSYRSRKNVSQNSTGDVAFQSWLSTKSKKINSEANLRKKMLEDKQKIEEERKRRAEEEYEQWLRKKQAEKNSKPTGFALSKRKSASEATLTTKSVSSSRSLPREDIQSRLLEWERKKIVQIERQKKQKKMEEERQRKKNEERRQLASQAWEKWSANAAKKPKPVPLNRGMFSLRGTVSSIYVNPNEWQSILPESN